MKQNNFLKSIVVVVASCLIFVACKKDDDINPVPDKASKLMFSWKITNITVPKVGQPATDSTVYKTCMSDDIIKFTSTGYDFQDGTAKCDSTIFPYSKGNWAYKIAADSIQLSSTAPVKYASWKIVILNDSMLQVKYTDSINPAKKVNKTISFKR